MDEPEELHDDDDDDDGILLDPLECWISGVTEHGRHRFRVPLLTEVVPGLWQGGCGSGLLLPPFIRHLVSLYPWERYACQHELDSTLALAMYDNEDQAFSQVPLAAAWVNECRRAGPVLVHCQAGFNRSSLVTATALMQEGLSAEEAISLLREKRSPACLCNPAFEAWVRAQQPPDLV